MLNRRSVLTGGATLATLAAHPAAMAQAPYRGRLKQGVSPTVFVPPPGTAAPNQTPMSLEDSCKLAAPLGITGFDLISTPAEWAILRRYGITPTMVRPELPGASAGAPPPARSPGWGALALKDAQGQYLAGVRERIDLCAAQKLPNIIVTAGTRDTVSDAEGADNAVAWFNAIKGHAEAKGVTLCMEILNSKGIRAPKNSIFDKMAWGVGVCERVNSPRVKILYDIWHAQLMEGNIVETIRNNIKWIAHVHTGGVPGRLQIQQNNELDYHFIAQALAELKFDGWVSHEWNSSPGSNVAENIRRAVEIMTV